MSLSCISDDSVQNMLDLKIIHLSKHNAIPLPKQNFGYSPQITTFFSLTHETSCNPILIHFCWIRSYVD